MRAAALLALLLAAAPLAAGAHGLTVNGTILFGWPGTAFTGGVSEVGGACAPASHLNGLDGVWVDATGFVGHPFNATPAATLDVDVWFYDATCRFVNNLTGARAGLGRPEAGTVPANTTFLVVDGFLGAGAFRLRLG